MHVTLAALQTAPSSKDTTDFVLATFTGMLVLVGGFQTYLFFRQAKFQEIALRQWVNVQDWGGAIRTASMGQRFFDGSFSIGNTTDHSLTILKIIIKACGQRVVFDNKNLLARAADHPVKFTMTLGSEELNQANMGRLVINVTGTITFLDVLGKTQSQPFGQACIWTPGRVTFEPYQGTLPE